MTRRAWVAFLVAGAAVAAGYYFGPFAGDSKLFEAVGLSGAVAILAGVKRHHPKGSLPWILFAIGTLALVAGDFTYFKLEGAFPSLADAFYLAAYPILATAMVMLVRRRTPGRDAATLLDVLIVATGLGVLAWVFLIEPNAHAKGLSWLGRVVTVAYPLWDVVLMAVTVRLAIGTGQRPRSFWFLLGGTVCLLLTDSAYGVIQLQGSYEKGSVIDAGWMITYLMWGAAALHPSMRHLSEPTAPREVVLTRARLAMLTVTTLLAPLTLIVRHDHSGADNISVVEVSSAVLFLLVLARITSLVADLHKAVSRHSEAERRERVLRQAAAALTTAPDRTAIAQSTVDAAIKLGEGIPGLDVRANLYWKPKAPAPGDGGGGTALGDLPLTLSLATPTAIYGTVHVGAAAPLPADFAAELETLVAQTAIALASASMAEDLSRQRSDARVGALVRNSSDVVMLLDDRLKISYVTPSVRRALGYRELEMVGRPVSRFLHPDDAGKPAVLSFGYSPDTCDATFPDFSGDLDGNRIEWRMRHCDGRWIDMEAVANDLRDNPSVNGIVITCRDIRERKALEDGLKAQVDKLQELDRIKGDFIATVSHELRTPLASIIGEVEMLADGDFGMLSSAQRHVIDVIERNSNRLLHLIEDLLTLNHIESGALELNRSDTNLEGLLLAVRRAVEARAGKHGIHLDFDLALDLKYAEVDAEQLHRALVNLLSNAIKFSHRGGCVGLVAEQSASEVIFTVADNGVGIPDDEQHRLFTRFFRSSVATEMAIQGSGLGLVIVKRIVEEHGGTISVESTLGRGTTVTFTIPLTRAAVTRTPTPVSRSLPN